jgi:hypothetical protein
MDVRFRWYVPESGHEWKRRKGESVLVWKEEKKGGPTMLDQPPVGLFRVFANINQQEREIRKFADTYGDILGEPGSSVYGEPGKDGIKPILRSHATLKTWMFAIEQMRFAVELWDRCNDANGRAITRKQARESLTKPKRACGVGKQ